VQINDRPWHKQIILEYFQYLFQIVELDVWNDLRWKLIVGNTSDGFW